MENAKKLSNNNTTVNYMTLSTNEVADVLGKYYKTVAKVRKARATQGQIKVTQKRVNNRQLDGYILSITDLQTIKNSFQKNKHLENDNNKHALQMLTNAIYTSENTDKEEQSKEDINVKFYE